MNTQLMQRVLFSFLFFARNLFQICTTWRLAQVSNPPCFLVWSRTSSVVSALSGLKSSCELIFRKKRLIVSVLCFVHFKLKVKCYSCGWGAGGGEFSFFFFCFPWQVFVMLVCLSVFFLLSTLSLSSVTSKEKFEHTQHLHIRPDMWHITIAARRSMYLQKICAPLSSTCFGFEGALSKRWHFHLTAAASRPSPPSSCQISFLEGGLCKKGNGWSGRLRFFLTPSRAASAWLHCIRVARAASPRKPTDVARLCEVTKVWRRRRLTTDSRARLHRFVDLEGKNASSVGS